jgi:hypothetical protein
MAFFTMTKLDNASSTDLFWNFQSALTLETNQKSVFGAIQVLGSRLSLLEPSHLDHVEGRLAALHQKMNAIADKKQVYHTAFLYTSSMDSYP